MQITHQAKRYSTDRMELIAERSIFNNGNYAGSNQLWRASDGTMFAATTSNGQDCYRNDALWIADDNDHIDNYDMTADQEARASVLGLIEIII